MFCGEALNSDSGDTVERVGLVGWVGSTSKIVSTNLAKLSMSRSSLVEAKMSCALVGRR